MNDGRGGAPCPWFASTDPGWTPRRISVTYLVLGVLWIVTSDALVAAVGTEFASTQRLQTLKGWFFVAGSAALVYVLVDRGNRRQRTILHQLQVTNRHVSVLHRVLRHNIRNAVTVIRGNAGLVAGGSDEFEGEAAAIDRYARALLRTSEKVRVLESIMEFGRVEREEMDIVPLVEDRIDMVRERFPEVDVTFDAPESARVLTTPHVEFVVEELIENAVLHTGTDARLVSVECRVDDGRVELTVSDSGPGIPASDAEALRASREDQLLHSSGVGLWVVKTLLETTDGEFTITPRQPRGTTATARFVRAST